MKKITYKILIVAFNLLCVSSISSQNIGVSGTFIQSTIQNCQTSELTIFFSNEDFVSTVSTGDAMITVAFPPSGEYSTPSDPPTGTNPNLFTWNLNGNTWEGLLNGDVGPLSSQDIVFEVTAQQLTAGQSTALTVTLLSGIDQNQVNNNANPALQIIENNTPLINNCPSTDQGTFSCIEDVPDPVLNVQDFIDQFGDNVINDGFCGDFTLTYFDDTTSMTTGCIMDPTIITRSYVFESAVSIDTCMVQYTIIDDQSPELTCQDITIELEDDGTINVDPELLVASITNVCNNPSQSITYSLSQDFFDCDDLDPNQPNCSNTFMVTLYAEDNCQNIDSCEANITIIDNTPPTINCPANTTINLQSGECSTTFVFDIPSASDNCDAFGMFSIATSITQISGTDLTSGDDFVPGIYTWSYEAVDGCGNTSQCNFSLTVVEFPIDDYILSLACNDLINISLNEDCTIELQADMILEGGPYKCYDEYIIEIEGIIGTVITTPGLYTVTITDPETGNNCWSEINVEDKLPPVIECETPFCETDLLFGAWDQQSQSFFPDQNCWDLGAGSPQNFVNFDVIEFDVETPGFYTFLMANNPNHNGVAAIYTDNFDPFNSCSGFLIGDDDSNGADAEPEIEIILAAGTYYLVSSSWAQSYMDDYTWTVTGPSSILAECRYKCYDFHAILDGEIATPLPQVTDCSDYSLSHSDSYYGDDCNGKFITRTYIATDVEGQSSTCEITLEFTPINIEEDVVEPMPIVELSCNQSTDPSDIASYFDNLATTDNSTTELIENHEGFVYGYPTYIQNGHSQKIDNNVCSIYAVYTDVEISACEEGCEGNKKVVRTWTVLDWCNSDIQTFKQTIKAIDKEAPTLTTSDISISTEYLDCKASFDVPHPANLHDNCDDSPEYDVSGPAGIIIQGSYISGFNVINAPKGIHTFYYNAYDCCGNQESYPFLVTVEDNTPPVVVAKQDIVVSLTNGSVDEDGYAKMFASSVDNGSHDGCSSALKYEIRRDSDVCGISGNTTYNADGHPQDGNSNSDTDNGAFVKFCCNDITNSVIDVNGDGINDPGYVKVWFRVWDDGDMDGTFGTDGDNYNEAWVHVKVEDKLDPFINCPQDVTITCDMDVDDLSITGAAEAIGVCGLIDVEYNDIVTNLNSCDQGFIRRRWSVVGNEQIFCDQNITVENENFATPIVSFANVGNFTAVGCPDMIAVGEPTWQAGVCDMMTYNVTTDTFKFEDGACFKLLREYTVINWCDYDPTNPQWVETDDFTDGFVQHIQVIKITDETKPVISSCEDQMFEVNDHLDTDNDGNNCEAIITLTNIANDEGSQNCPTGWLKWEVFVDLWSDGVDDLEYSSYLHSFDTNFNDSNGNGIPDVYVSPTFNGEEINVVLPEIEGSMSNHKVLWRVSDGCGNITSCSSNFMVVDKKAPTPYCIDISSAVMESSGTVEIWAVDFNIGSFDNCTSPENLRYTFSETPPSQDSNYDDSKKSSRQIFTCDDVINSPVEVKMYVWDEKDNFDFCYVHLSLVDNNEACGDGMKVSGTIATENGIAASNVEVNLNAILPEYPRVLYTDNDGSYTFYNTPTNSEYEVSAIHDKDYLNGVSTLDLVKIQRHLLGLESLNSPYKLIAADINGDNSIKASDLTNLRKLILGIYSKIEGNESWKFIDASQDLDMNMDLEDVSYESHIPYLNSNKENVDFVAVKIGDVTENAVLNYSGNKLSEVRSTNTFTFTYFDEIIEENEVVSLSIISNDKVDLLGYQFTINLNGLEYKEVESGLLNMKNEFIGNIDQNTVSVSYNTSTPTFIESNKNLFTLHFVSKKKGKISDMLSFNNKIVEPEAYTMAKGGIIETVPVSLEVESEINENIEIQLYQNKPNPFRENTIIGYDLTEDEEVEFTFYNTKGQLLKSIKHNGKRGFNQLEINSSELTSRGIIIYKLESKDFIQTKKMIIIE